MTDPAARHAVCPECHTHQATLPDGRLAEHPLDKDGAIRCPGSEDWPNRAAGRTGYDVTSAFASCPACTGPSRCAHFPDGSHRCQHARDHYDTDPLPADRRTHLCTCGAQWTSLMGSLGQLFETVLKPSETLTTKLLTEHAGDDRAVTLLRYALHLRMYGENAPGGNETWAEFDRRAEALLRTLPPQVGHSTNARDEADV